MKRLGETPFGSIRQIGILTENLESFQEEYRRLYSLEPDKKSLVPVDAKEDSCQRKLAFYQFPEVEVEVIEPVQSKPEWHDFLQKHGGSIHHIQFNVDPLEDACKRLEAAGCRIIERGYSINVPEVQYVFFDTVQRLGYVTELVNFKEIERLKG